MEQKTDDRAALPAALLTGEAVTAYLRQHPNFLFEHPEIARILTPPTHANGDDLVDFGRFLIDRLRSEIAALTARESKLITTVETNVSGQGRVHRATLKLLDAPTPEKLARTVQVDFPAILGIGAATLCLGQVATDALYGEQHDGAVVPPEQIARLLTPGRDAALRQVSNEDKALFGTAGDGVRSVAMLRLVLGRNAPPGILALGSERAEGFHPNQATDLLVFLARVAESRLRQWLAPPP